MKKEKLEIDVLVDEGEKPFRLGQIINGKVIIRAKNDVAVEYLHCSLLFESRGLTNTSVGQIADVHSLGESIFREGETYIYPITFKNEKFETYRGENVELLIKLEVTAKPVSEKRYQQTLSKVQYFDRLSQISKSRYLDFVAAESDYELVSSRVEMKLKLLDEILLSSLIILIVASFFIARTEYYESYRWLLLTIGGILALLNILYSLFAKYTVGPIDVMLNDIGNREFEVKMSNRSRGKNIRRIQLTYQIEEEVIDNRGTSQSKELATIYTSDVKTLEDGFRGETVRFSYPVDKPSTMKYKDVRIFWSLNLNIHTFLDFRFSCRREFEVKRKQL